MYCSSCGRELSDRARFCSECGSPTGVVESDGHLRTETTRTRNVSVAFIVSAYFVAVLFPIAGLLMSIYLAFKCERLHSYGVFAVTLIALAGYGIYFNS